jgi:hypothetical protein
MRPNIPLIASIEIDLIAETAIEWSTAKISRIVKRLGAKISGGAGAEAQN